MAEATPTERPNVLWICTDQQRFDTLGAYGNDLVDTENIDQLAENGVRFERAFCQSPVCTPSRASFLTGRYPRTTRCRQNGQPLPRDEDLVTKTLAEAGYRCGLAGKLHLSPTNADESWGPVVEEPARRVDDGYAAFRWAPAPGQDHPANEYRDWLRDRDVTYETPPFDGSDYVEAGMAPPNHHTTWCANRAASFVEANEDRDDPWLYSVNFFDPHHPFDPPREYLDPYLDDLSDVPLPAYEEGELGDKPAFQREAHDTGRFAWSEMDEDDHRLVKAAYFAMIDLVDDQVGRLLDALERTGQREETLVVFTSDHGELLGDHGLYKKGPYFYEPAVRVPLVVSWPGRFDGGRSVSDLVELVDVAPTLLDVAGVDRPEGMQGRSLRPNLADDATTDDGRDAVYCEFYNASRRHTDPPAYATMVRTDRYKLVSVHGRGTGELYDLSTDPRESTNRWTDPEYVEVKAALLERLSDAMARTVDPLPERAGSW